MDRHEAVQLVSTKEITLDGEVATKLVLNYELLKFLSEQIGDRKVAIISIAGTFRTGKGFLFSLFVHYLEWLAAGAKGSWIDFNRKINNFHWKNGCLGDTKGIYVYNKPFIVQTKTEDEIAIILMGTQGIDNIQLTEEVSSIFDLSTMLSSVQIYNLMNNINTPDLQHLSFFTHLASYSRRTAEGNAKIFQSLYFLIRDWSCPSEKEFGAEGGDALVKEILKKHSIRNDELKEICTKLEDNFETVNGFLLPYPGVIVAYNNNNSYRILEEMKIKPDFLNHASDLFLKLILNAKPKMIENEPLKGISLLNIFEQYVKAFQENTVPQPDSMLRSNNRVGCMNARDSAVKQYNQMMDSILKKSTTEESLRNAHEKAYDEVLTYFKSIIPKEFGNENDDEALQELIEILKTQLRLVLIDIMCGDIEKLRSRCNIL